MCEFCIGLDILANRNNRTYWWPVLLVVLNSVVVDSLIIVVSIVCEFCFALNPYFVI